MAVKCRGTALPRYERSRRDGGAEQLIESQRGIGTTRTGHSSGLLATIRELTHVLSGCTHSNMIRLALACLLALTMATAPLRASAAISSYDAMSAHAEMAMNCDMAMAHSAMPDSTTGHPTKATCADMCAAAAAAAAVLPAALAVEPVSVGMTIPHSLAPQGLASREPDRFDPPPKPRG